MRRIPNSGQKAGGASLVELDDVKVPVENLLGKENEGFKVIMVNFNRERYIMSVGCNRKARKSLSTPLIHLIPHSNVLDRNLPISSLQLRQHPHHLRQTPHRQPNHRRQILHPSPLHRIALGLARTNRLRRPTVTPRLARARRRWPHCPRQSAGWPDPGDGEPRGSAGAWWGRVSEGGSWGGCGADE